MNESRIDSLPLSSVRAFAAVGKLLSISRAAEELEVTPSAVSHHIKALEKYLDAQLVRRDGNRIALTPYGQRYLPQVADGLTLLANASKALRAVRDQPVIRVACPPSLAVLWLIPRVARFMEQQKGAVVAVTSCPNPLASFESNFDVGFWYGHGVVSGMQLSPLATNRMFPICHRRLLESGALTLADLPRFHLLDSSDEAYYDKMQPRLSWRAWLRAAGALENPGMKFLNFTPHVLMHSAVEAKLGIGLTRTLLAVDSLDSGELALPFGAGLVQTANYHFVCASVVAKRKDVQVFRDWVLAEADASAKRLDRHVAALGGGSAVVSVERRKVRR